MLSDQEKTKLKAFLFRCKSDIPKLLGDHKYSRGILDGQSANLNLFLHDAPLQLKPKEYARFIYDLFTVINALKSRRESLDELIEIENIFIAQTKLFFEQDKGNELNKIINLRAQGEESLTLLFISKACELPEELIRFYIDELNINLNVFYYDGSTPLIWAIANAANTGAKNILRAIQGKPYQKEMIDVTSPHYGNAAIHVVVAKGYRNFSADQTPIDTSNLELLQLLIAGGADINARTQKVGVDESAPDVGNTALHYACAKRDKEYITYLLKKGADPTIRNAQGKTALDLLSVSKVEAQKYVNQITPNNFLEIYSEGKQIVREISILFTRVEHLTKVNEQLDILSDKRAEFVEKQALCLKNNPGNTKKATKYEHAINAISNIHNQVTGLYNQYINGNIELDAFKARAKPLLQEENPDVKTLKTHRGVARILVNLLAAIFSAGVIYGIAALIKGELMLFNPPTDTAKKANDLRDSIDNAKPPKHK